MAKNWGFNVRELDTKIRPQDDFFHYVNNAWMRANPVPAHESRWGTFIILRYKTERQIRALLHEIISKKSAVKGSSEQMIRDFYRSGMDMKQRNALGALPLTPILKRIHAIKTQKDLLKTIAYLHRIGGGVAWDSGIDQDDKDNEQYVLRLFQGGIGLPDRDYYLKNDAESKRVRDAYVTHVKNIYKLMGRSSEEAARDTERFMALETELARASMSKEERRDPHKTYHKLTITA